ncbi:unnamed protein product [Ceutorhynchus assimilis]|uniref:Gamma-tubulin complex component n=1 Tax=Ceutorhynchus assimilis TaxID=467358 RepID=A0A9N9MTJ7_9CUCU|nr:unnamed protein product [Ceutorhynchus assimilis]
MSRALLEEVVTPAKELITKLSGFEEGSDEFNHVLKYFKAVLNKADTMYFLNKRDVDRNIEGMSEKFCFHGFFKEADALKAAYKMYFPEHLPKAEISTRLNVVQFLMCMSETPTKHFLEHPDALVKQSVDAEQEIDWGAYLKTGVEPWMPNYDESSDNDSYGSFEDPDGEESQSPSDSTSLLPVHIKSADKICTMDFNASREELLRTIQHSWYTQENFFMEPQSQRREANIGILWEKYLKEQVHGLIILKSPSIISEYNVVREILWQLWCPISSSTLEFSGNCLRPRPDITLASVRSYAFYTFMGEFIPYIELLEYFREFERSLQCDFNVCRTYQSYCACITTIIDPIYKKLIEVENEVRQQETTYTLLTLADELSRIFQPIKMLQEIHEQIIIDHNTNDPLKCATKLIVGLHESLNFTASKQEQDLKLALFLGTLYHYLGLVDSWLIKDDLVDYTGEFVIEKRITLDRWHTQFVPRDGMDESWKKNSFLKVFIENILKVGKNINFLRLLGKYDIIGDCQESIYNEFINETFKKLSKFNNNEKQLFEEAEILNEECSDLIKLINEENFINPVLGTELSKTNLEVQKLENLVDIQDPFLVTAFAEFFVGRTPVETNEDVSLYNRIARTTQNLFPKTNFFESTLINIIESRFTVSGLMVKKLLIEDHLLEKQFEFLRHLYLFFDDLIFPFYRRLFVKTDSSCKSWANDIWLTSHLHDIFIDIYPEFYEKCSVQLQKNWNLCTDSLSACSLINFNYEMPWPLNIIIKPEQMELYKEIFQFLLKIKWALHTVNHLTFSDLTKSNMKSQKAFKATAHKNKPTAKLIRLKFSLINLLNSLQHFVFGFVFGKNVQRFELTFEKAYDLNSIIESHSEFINSVAKIISDLKRKMMEKDKDNNISNCIKLLKLMWNDLRYASAERINDCNKIYETIFSDINPVIFPEYIYDY